LKENVLKLLYVDDSELDAELVRSALEKACPGCHVDWVHDFSAYRQALNAVAYDLILSDYALPDCNGLQLFAEARAHDNDIPFILITGALGDESAIETVKAGITDYILKSNLERLQTAIPQALEQARRERDRKETLQALRLSEERFDLAVRGSGAGIWDWSDVSINDMWLSPRIYELLGYPEGEKEKPFSNLDELIHPEDLPAASKALADHFSGQQPYDIEYRIRHQKGHYIWFRSRGKAIFDNGVPRRMAGYVQDLTERKTAEVQRLSLENQLRQAQKLEALGTLAGGIAHDFNNILASILGYTSLVERRMPADSREKLDLQEVLRAADRAKKLVGQILTFCRKSEVKKEPVFPDLVIQETLALLKASLPATIEISSSLNSHGEAVLGDATHIHQVIMNLCTNAYHAMPQGGTLTISLQKRQIGAGTSLPLVPGDYLEILVTDTGSGIPAELLPKIFDPYFTTKPIDSGTGLGLSVVKGIIEGMKGFIGVESQVGRGTNFQILLPCHQDIMPQESAPPAKQCAAGGSEHLLFIDDELGLVQLGKKFLESLGYQVTTQCSSQEALELVGTRPQDFDLVITDQAMPQMSGITLAKQLKKIAPALPVILCSGLYVPLEPELLAETSIRNFLLKTDLMDKLPGMLREVLDG